MGEWIVRFVAGGLIVCLFATTGAVSKRKSFAGLFGAAPSVALVSLTLALKSHGAAYTTVEARSMVAGAAALLAYSAVGALLIRRARLDALPAAATSFGAWFLIALLGFFCMRWVIG